MSLRTLLVGTPWLVIAGLVAAMVLLPSAEHVRAAGTIATPDLTGDVGQHSYIVLDAAGNPVISYYDNTTHDLKLLHCGNASCTSGNSITSPDTGGDVGKYTTVALDSSGNPVVSYYDGTNLKLKVMHCNDPNCDSAVNGVESVVTPDGSANVGTQAWLVLDSTGKPVVAYYDAANGNLKLLHCGNANCTSGNSITSPDSSANTVGSFTSLALDGVGKPVISYYDATASDLKVLHCDDVNCTGNESASIATPDMDNAGADTAIVLDGTGNPVVSYGHYATSDVRVLHCGNATCTAGNSIITVAATGVFDTSLKLDGSGNPVVVYSDDGAGDLMVLHCGNANCTLGNSNLAVDDFGLGGESFSSLALDSSGNPVVSYFERSGVFNLNVLHCSNPNCAEGKVVLVAITGDGIAGDCANGTTSVDCRVNFLGGMYLYEGSGGGGGQAASASDSALYYADSNNHKVKRIEPAPPKLSGTTYDVAGNGTAGFSGDGGPATQASLNTPRDVFVHSNGDIYIADALNCVVRKVSGGTITTVAGEAPNPELHCGYDGDNQAAVGAKLYAPRGIAVDGAGNLYIADTENHRIRKVDAGTGQITTIVNTAGTAGSGGDGGPAETAALRRPYDVYFLLPEGDLLIADAEDNKVRRIDYPAGVIGTLAGTGTAGYSGDGGPATSARLNGPKAVVAKDYRVAIADTDNDVVRVVNVLTGEIYTAAGGLATLQTLDDPRGVVIAPDGSLAIANTGQETIVAAGVDLEGNQATTFRPTHSCTMLPGIQSIDWVLPALLLGAIAARRRLGSLFVRLALAGRRRVATAAA